MKTLLLDADGVFVDFTKGFLQKIYEVTGKRFAAEQITGFRICQALGLTDAEEKAVWESIKPGFCTDLEPIPGAIEAIQRLMLIADIYVVTSPVNRVPTWTHEREKWIRKHLGIHHSQVLHGSAKHLVRGDFFVDDRADTCEQWDLHNAGTAIMWESPWNIKFPWNGHRFNNWAKLETLIQNGSLEPERLK